MGLASSVDLLIFSSLYKAKKQEIPPEILCRIRILIFIISRLHAIFSLRVKPGLKELELSIEFGYKGRAGQRRPTVQDYFPQTEWKKYATATLAFGIKADLTFDVPMMQPNIPFVTTDVGTNVSASFLSPIVYKFEKCQNLGNR